MSYNCRSGHFCCCCCCFLLCLPPGSFRYTELCLLFIRYIMHTTCLACFVSSTVESVVGNHKRNWYHRPSYFLSSPYMRISRVCRFLRWVSLLLHKQGMAGVSVYVSSKWAQGGRGLTGSCSFLPLHGSNSQASGSALRKPAVSIADSTELRWVKGPWALDRGDEWRVLPFFQIPDVWDSTF